jgi:hypothetical protein
MRVPDSRTGALPSHLELVKIRRDTFQSLIEDYPALKRRVEEIVVVRKRRATTCGRRPNSMSWGSCRDRS